jgi:hypothetical protein
MPTDGAFKEEVNRQEAIEANRILLELVDLYVYVIPSEMILGAFVAFIRALGQQNTFIYCQLIVFYGFHMVALYFFLYHTDLLAKGLIINLGLTYTVMIVCTSIITLMVNWKRHSITIRREMKKEEEEESRKVTKYES